MARSTLSLSLALVSASCVLAQSLSTFPATPLVAMTFPYSALPEQAVSLTYVRGTQSGYNICNSSTQNQQSMCQTAVINNIFDFALFAPPQPNTNIADSEGVEVVWSTSNTHGSRVIPPNTFTGLQVLNTSQYIQYIGFINQALVNINSTDFGGELDPGGQDENGNPIGGLVYSTAFSTGGSEQQIINWNVFIGGGLVGIKICNPTGTNPAGYCQHTLDRIGLAYNMPGTPKNGTFEVCDSDLMDVPGVYTSGGQTLSYSQPAESLGPITTIPYTPRIPASSNCQTYQSTDLFKVTTGFPTSTASPAGSTGVKTGSGSTGTRTGSSSPASSTSGSNGAGVVTISLFSSILGVAFSVAFLA